MIRAAKWAGATAVKVQLYTPDQLTVDSSDSEFRITEGLWAGYTLYELYRKAYMPHEWVPELKTLADELDMAFIASIYHPDMVPVAEGYGIEIYKVSSFEFSYPDLRKALAQTGKPVIFSTGTSTLTEIQQVVDEFKGKEIAMLKCVSQYPAPLTSMNLATIPDMRARFKVPIGLSDHTTGIVCSIVAVALGATIIEKHFKIDNDGFDVAFSIDPRQFKTMVETIRAAEQCVGKIDYAPSTSKYKRREVNGRWIRTVN